MSIIYNTIINFDINIKKRIRREKQYGIPFLYLIEKSENRYEYIVNDEFEYKIVLAIKTKWEARKLERSLKKKEEQFNKKLNKI